MRTEDVHAAIGRLVLAEIPKLLTLLDRTPVSPTYGCFDRSYWHYRTIDFPCGMSQEFVLPLALVWSMDGLGANPYFRQPAVRAYVEAGIRYAARSAHGDGSCDDYYPFEKAAGAAAFSLFACLEAAATVHLDLDDEVKTFFRKRADWLAKHEESGRLSNHEALIASCLARMHDLFPDAGYDVALHRRVKRLLSWQDSEGWFDEYGGADIGYLSLTIGLLADLDRRRPDLGLREPVAKAIRFLAHFVHPDGGAGGEYSSRGTLNFFPFGFEIAGAWMPEALAINDLALRPVLEGRTPCYSDDRIVAHHLWGWLFTAREYKSNRPPAAAASIGRTWFPNCGLIVERTGDAMLVANLKRGGIYKYFGGGRLSVSDTGVTLRIGGRVAVGHGQGGIDLTDHGFTVESPLVWAKSARLTPVKNIVFRAVMLGPGRLFPDLVRRLLQKVLVTGQGNAPFSVRRSFRKHGKGWLVRDEVTPESGWSGVMSAGISGHQVSTTTIMARVYQQDQLAPFIDLTADVTRLESGQPLVFERRLGEGA